MATSKKIARALQEAEEKRRPKADPRYQGGIPMCELPKGARKAETQTARTPKPEPSKAGSWSERNLGKKDLASFQVALNYLDCARDDLERAVEEFEFLRNEPAFKEGTVAGEWLDGVLGSLSCASSDATGAHADFWTLDEKDRERMPWEPLR